MEVSGYKTLDTVSANIAVSNFMKQYSLMISYRDYRSF